ncbi:MAG: hypothetical protein ABI402_06100 [Ferruginibacter sp.]
MKEIYDAFDPGKRIYEQHIFPNDRLFQFMRNSSQGNSSVQTGNWFCLAGGNMNGVAIFSGGSGRQLIEFKANHPLIVLEGTANKMDINWKLAIGNGQGGMTQIYIPRNLLFSLEAIGKR